MIRLLLFLTLTVFSSNLLPQIIFRGLPGKKIQKEDLDYLGSSGLRDRIILNGEWKVVPEGENPESAAKVNIPSVFSGGIVLTFSRDFRIAADKIKNNSFRVTVLGLLYSAEISVNGSLIYRHFGGAMPFEFEIPRDILYPDRPNSLSIKLSPSLDSESTIPLIQRHRFPAYYPGIFRDIFIDVLPLISLEEVRQTYKVSPSRDNLKLKISAKVKNNRFATDSTTSSFELVTSVVSMSTGVAVDAKSAVFEIKKGREKYLTVEADIKAPKLWSPSDPQLYQIKTKLLNQGKVIDEITRTAGFYSFVQSNDSITLNGSKFRFNGTVYYPDNGNLGSMLSHREMSRDLEIIKEAGFNTVRFAKELPHPFLISECERIGLFAFIEVPVNSVPLSFITSTDYINRVKGYISRTVKYYQRFSAVAAVGLGSSYLPDNESVKFFVTEIEKHTRQNWEGFTYASFSGSEIEKTGELDFYGLEFTNPDLGIMKEKITAAEEIAGRGKVFLSEVGYSHHFGHSNGYINPYTFESQAKFYNDFLIYADSAGLTGFFINSIFDYHPSAPPITLMPLENGAVPLGLADISRGKNRLAFKVVSAFLNNTERVSIPIGIKESKAPASFVVAGLIAALLIGFMINSGKKFREDAVRALLRPYNFFADIRDVRLISGFQTIFLMLVIALLSGDMLASLLHYLRNSVFFEKFIIAFGSEELVRLTGYLVWSPVMAIFWLSLFSLIFLILLSLMVRIGSLFVMNKVSLINSYFTVVWSFVPFAILTPVAIILYRVLETNLINPYIYAAVIFFYIWCLYRLFKGIYVIYDVAPGRVFFIGTVLLLTIVAAVLIYYQIIYSTIDHIIYAWLQVKGSAV